VIMSREHFEQIFIEASSEVADEFYPKNEYSCCGPIGICGREEHIQTERSKRRGEYLRDQGVLCAKLSELLEQEGVIR
jgi:hypothetical protein